MDDKSATGNSYRYIRVVAKNLGTCPPGHPGSGKKSWLFVDEVTVE
jgi:hexosaminidase